MSPWLRRYGIQKSTLERLSDMLAQLKNRDKGTEVPLGIAHHGYHDAWDVRAMLDDAVTGLWNAVERIDELEDQVRRLRGGDR